MRVFYHIAKADFLERVRRYGFLLTLVAAAYAAWGFVPPRDASWATLYIGGARGIYNSAWIGAQVALLTTVFLTLVGFYLIKNAIDRDYTTRVGQIIAATPLSKLRYTVGKMLSNTAVLFAIVLVLIVVALVMQWIRAEDRSIDLIALVIPFLYALLPVCLLIGAIAVLFESISFLRGGLGNVVYFFLVIACLASQITDKADVFGMAAYTDSMKAVAITTFPDTVNPEMEMNMGIHVHDDGRPFELRTFQWDGATITPTMVGGRLVLVLIAFGIAFIASLLFDRFDSARATEPAQKKPSRLNRLVARIESALTPSRPASAQTVTHLTPLAMAVAKPRLLKTVFAELRIMLKGQHGIWYLGALGLVIAGALAPISAGQGVLLPIAWLWPALIWSQMGCREVRQGTNQYIFSSAQPLTRQLPATWLAGAFLATLTGSGVALHLLIIGDIAGLAAWIVGALFVPALALACGVWTNGSRLFEALYLFWWYAGPLNKAPGLDYMGAAGQLHTTGTTVGYAIVTIALLILAVLGRRRQLYV